MSSHGQVAVGDVTFCVVSTTCFLSLVALSKNRDRNHVIVRHRH